MLPLKQNHSWLALYQLQFLSLKKFQFGYNLKSRELTFFQPLIQYPLVNCINFKHFNQSCCYHFLQGLDLIVCPTNWLVLQSSVNTEHLELIKGKHWSFDQGKSRRWGLAFNFFFMILQFISTRLNKLMGSNYNKIIAVVYRVTMKYPPSPF